VALELREATGARRQFKKQVDGFDLPQRRVVRPHTGEDGLKESAGVARGQASGARQASVVRQTGRSEDERGRTARIGVGRCLQQADGGGRTVDGGGRNGRAQRAQILPGQPVVVRGPGVTDQRRRDVPGRGVELFAAEARFSQRQRREPPQHQFQVAGVHSHAQLRLGGQRNGIARVFLGPAFEQRFVGRIGREVLVLPENIGPQVFVKAVVKVVLPVDCCAENIGQPRVADLVGHDEILVEQHVALGLFRVGAQAEFFDFLHQQAGNADHVDVEDGVFGHGGMPHFKNDVAVGAACLFHFGARVAPKLVHRFGAAADARVGGGDRLRRQLLLQG